MNQMMTIGKSFKIPQERVEQIYQDREIEELWRKLAERPKFKELFPLQNEQMTLKGCILTEAIEIMLLDGMDLKEAVIAKIIQFKEESI